MSNFVTAVVIHEDGERVLLHQRKDFRWWALPGGNIEDGESPGQAAIRETFEETGYQIEIDKFVGKYYRPQLNDVREIISVAQNAGTEPLSKEVRYPELLIFVWKALIRLRDFRNRVQGRV